MKIKICGLKHSHNIQELSELNLDMMGFIFYDKSSRFVNQDLDTKVLKSLPRSIKKIGVFVNESLDKILAIKRAYDLDYVQLHGDETAEFCKALQQEKLRIIKAFSVDESFDFEKTMSYGSICDYFLFDTKGTKYGGNGSSFNWELLKNYKGEVPFLLSGGIGTENIKQALSIRHEKLAGFDINSKIEIEPALKSTQQAKEIIDQIKSEYYEHN